MTKFHNQKVMWCNFLYAPFSVELIVLVLGIFVGLAVLVSVLGLREVSLEPVDGDSVVSVELSSEVSRL